MPNWDNSTTKRSKLQLAANSTKRAVAAAMMQQFVFHTFVQDEDRNVKRITAGRILMIGMLFQVGKSLWHQE